MSSTMFLPCLSAILYYCTSILCTLICNHSVENSTEEQTIINYSNKNSHQEQEQT